LNDDGKNDKTMALAQLKDPKDAKRFFVFFFFYFFSASSRNSGSYYLLFLLLPHNTLTHIFK